MPGCGKCVLCAGVEGKRVCRQDDGRIGEGARKMAAERGDKMSIHSTVFRYWKGIMLGSCFIVARDEVLTMLNRNTMRGTDGIHFLLVMLRCLQ